MEEWMDGHIQQLVLNATSIRLAVHRRQLLHATRESFSHLASWISTFISTSFALRSTSQQSQHEADEKEDVNGRTLIKFTADVRFKDTVNQRMEKARSLGTISIYGDTWEDIRCFLWRKFHRYMENMAHCDREQETPVWSISEEDPTMDEFPKRFSLRLDTKQLKSFENPAQRSFILKHPRETFMLSVFKYGNELVSNPDLMEFEAQCLRPSERDRAGAASEAHIQQTIHDIKAEWANILQAQEISWRLWAVAIVRLKKTAQQRLAIIREGPPNYVGGFRPISSTAEVHMSRVTKSVKMAYNLALAFDEELKTFERKFQLLNSDLTALRRMIHTQLELVRAFGEEIAINPDDTRVLAALRAIPRQTDVDHGP
ncbi:hypothetical protein AC1031_005581 [Aphanomyces cochlioides]|nr:hypothetical protein AC1031_005581 [Aphanomyces cochlioides]